jgi:hypothetical protein
MSDKTRLFYDHLQLYLRLVTLPYSGARLQAHVHVTWGYVFTHTHQLATGQYECSVTNNTMLSRSVRNKRACTSKYQKVKLQRNAFSIHLSARPTRQNGRSTKLTSRVPPRTSLHGALLEHKSKLIFIMACALDQAVEWT